MASLNISGQNGSFSSNDFNREIRILELNRDFINKVWPAFILWGIIGVVGVVGNGTIFLMLWLGKKLRQKPLRRHILALAAVDFFGCLILIPAEIYRYTNMVSDGMELFYKIKCSLNVVYMTCSCFILVSIAVDRHRALAYPLQVSARQTTSNLLRWTLFRRVVYAIFVPLLSIPPLFLCGAAPSVESDGNGGNMTLFVNGGDQRYDKHWSHVYKLTAACVQVFFSCVLIILYVKIALFVRDRTRHASNASIRYKDSGELEHSGRRRRVPTNIKIYFIVTAVFVSTYLLYIGLTSVKSVKLSDELFLVYTIAYKLYYIHSTVMPLLCLKMDIKLRHHFLSIFSRQRRRKASTAFSTSSALSFST